MTTEHNNTDSEFDALLSSVLEERKADVPRGLQQRLIARFEGAPQPRAVSQPSFRDFGVLETGKRSSRSFFTSLAANFALLALMVVVGSVVRTKIAAPESRAMLVAPVAPPPPPVEHHLPPPPPPKKMEAPRPEPPKIELPKPEVVPIPSPLMPAAQPKLAPAPAPAKVMAAPAPKPVTLAATPASIPNRDSQPKAVALGRPDSPLKPLNGPAVSAVRMGGGMPKMPADNDGSGPAAQKVTMGSGLQQGQVANRQVARVQLKGSDIGVAGATGTANAPVSITAFAAAPLPPVRERSSGTVATPKPPVITYIPKPAYTDEARSLHLEGEVRVKVRFRANGTIDVLGIDRGIGHGLDETALNAARSVRFSPARDAAGNATDFATVITVRFTMN